MGSPKELPMCVFAYFVYAKLARRDMSDRASDCLREWRMNEDCGEAQASVLRARLGQQCGCLSAFDSPSARAVPLCLLRRYTQQSCELLHRTVVCATA